MSSCGGGIGVHVQSAWHGGLSFASHHPDSRCRKTNFDKKVNVALSRPKGQKPLLLRLLWVHFKEIDGGADEKSQELHLFDAGVELMMLKKIYI